MTALVLTCLAIGFVAGLWVGVRLTERAIARAAARNTIRNQSGWRRDRGLLDALLRPGARS